MPNVLRRILFTGVLTALSVPAVAGNSIIADGKFLEGSAAGAFTTYAYGTSFGPWQSYIASDTYPGSVDLIGNYWGHPPGGGFSVDLAGTFNSNGSSSADAEGSILQFFNVTKAGRYSLSYFISGNQDGGAILKTYYTEVRAQASGADSQVNFGSTTNSAQAGAWTRVTQPLTFSETGMHYLLIGGYGAPRSQYGAVIGDVALSAVPEPSNWALLAIGMGLVGAIVRTRNRNVVSLSSKTA